MVTFTACEELYMKKYIRKIYKLFIKLKTVIATFDGDYTLLPMSFVPSWQR